MTDNQDLRYNTRWEVFESVGEGAIPETLVFIGNLEQVRAYVQRLEIATGKDWMYSMPNQNAPSLMPTTCCGGKCQ